MICVLICDDHQIVRQGIKQILADASDLSLAGEAASGPEAIARVRAGGIDVVLMDIAMPQRDGLDVLKQLKAEFPKLPVLMLSTYPDRQYAVRSLKLGAAGYLNKSADAEQMTEAIRRALEERLDRLRAKARADVRGVELSQLIDRGRRRPVLDPRSPEEILGYGPDGVPL